MTHPPGWRGGSDGKVASQQGPRVQPAAASGDSSHVSRVAPSSKQHQAPVSGSDTWPSLSPPQLSDSDINAHDTQPIPITRIISKAWTVPVTPARPSVPNWFMKALARLLGGRRAQ